MIWRRLSLVQRLTGASAVAIMLTGTALLYGIVRHDLRAGQAELERRIGHELDAILPSMTDPVVLGDYARTEQIVKAWAAQPEIAQARFTDASGVVVAANVPAHASIAPRWFVRLAALEPVEKMRPMAVGGREYGTVSLVMDPGPTFDQIWLRLSGSITVLAAGIFALFLVILAIARSSLKPIGELAATARRFGSGDYTVRIASADGPPEILASVRAFNGLADNIASLVHSLGESRAQLVVEKDHLSWQATHDALTGLVNRPEFERRLKLMVQQANIDRTRHALLYLDLDQFKLVNDTCGHMAGDELLRQASVILRKRVREADTLARLGGDEFGVLLPGCTLEKAVSVAEELRAALHDARFAWNDKPFVIAASIGVVAVGDGDTHDRALAAADTACYAAKESGRNRVKAYTPDDAELAKHHSEMHWVTRIRHALDAARFRLDCQRIEPISRHAGPIEHYEILVRLLDEKDQTVLPMAFIPAAERFGLMPEIDRMVVRTAFEAVARAVRSSPGSAFPHLAINLSGTSLGDEGMVAFLREQFDIHGVPPSTICFEITETAAIGNLTAATRLMLAVKELGCRFSLDDFGSGLSSFAYLKNLPVDMLKIDGAFVKDLVRDPIDSAMVRAINDIGHVMGLRTIAEWVENQETLVALRAIGVDYAQGFGVEKPRPLSQMLEEKLPATADVVSIRSARR
jgi:diguanylate cyclase (GGDEF)-like protein